MTNDVTMTMTDPHSATEGPFNLDHLVAAAGATVIEPMTAKAAEVVIRDGKCSTSYIQRKLGVGYNKAARIMEYLEEMGVVTSADHIGKREVVATAVPTELVRAAEAASRVAKGKPPVKETPEDKAVTDGVYRVAANELRQFVERVERLEAEKKDIAEQIKEVYAESKSRGYDNKAMRKLIALRKRDKDALAEEEAVLEMYKEALGM